MNNEGGIALVHLIYASRAAQPLTEEGLVELLNSARTSNSSINVTGMLLHCEGSFFQVLEGSRAILEPLFEKIAKDNRHHHVIKLIVEPIEERALCEWTMGFQNVTLLELVSITGVTDFLDRGSQGFDGIESKRARQLIDAFRGGRWHKSDLTQYKIISVGS